jgi:hypothetical protein
MAIGLLRLPSRSGGCRGVTAFTGPLPARGGAGDRLDGAWIQIEQNPQRRGVFLAPRRAREFLDPHRRRMQQLLHHPPHGLGGLIETVPAQVVGVQPPGQPGQLGVDHLGRLGPQRYHRRGHPHGVYSRLVGGQFGLENGPHRGDVIVSGHRPVLGQRVQADQRHAWQGGHRGLHIPRHREVEEHEGLAPPGGHHVCRNHMVGRAGAADHDVRPRHGGGQAV